MNWTESQIRDFAIDMAEENPLACRSLLEIAEIEFTTSVPTMAVLLSEQPVLRINLEFCRQHLTSENDVKCVLLHEFLHVLLLHTSTYKTSDQLLNIALDAIINAIIHRMKGLAYSEFFIRYYRIAPVEVLLRPVHVFPWEDAFQNLNPIWRKLHSLIYEKGFCADELHELLQSMQINGLHAECAGEGIPLLGNHEKQPIHPQMKKLLDDTMKKMTGTNIWKSIDRPGEGTAEKKEEYLLRNFRISRWQQITAEIIRKCLTRDAAATEEKSTCVVLPVLSHTDRRAFLRFKPGGLIPLSVHEQTSIEPKELATVYLDVSGSMEAELEALGTLLYSMRQMIRLPLFAFSDSLTEARLVNGRLDAKTSGGTNINAVFDHIIKNQTKRALIVTDGYIKPPDKRLTMGMKKSNWNFLISNNGSTSTVHAEGFPYQMLPAVDWNNQQKS